MPDARRPPITWKNVTKWLRRRRRGLLARLRTLVRGDAERIPIVMCTWRRIEQLPRTIAMLERQRGVGRPLLCIWNNNAEAREEIDRIVATADRVEVRVHHSETNIGGEGRFHFARRLAPEHPFVILLDDDAVFADDWGLASFVSEATPRSLRSHWSFRFRPGGRYWDRDRAMPGEPAHYTGTSALVADASIFLRDDVFECPDQWRFIEDVWLSFVAQHRGGFDLRASETAVVLDEDGKGQLRSIGPKKTEMLHYLRSEMGWQV